MDSVKDFLKGLKVHHYIVFGLVIAIGIFNAVTALSPQIKQKQRESNIEKTFDQWWEDEGAKQFESVGLKADEKTRNEEFEQFRADYLEQFKENLWCDSTMKEIVENWEVNENESYASNIADIIIAFCRIIDDETLSYYEDDNVVEWIETQDFDFTEDGRVYHG